MRVPRQQAEQAPLAQILESCDRAHMRSMTSRWILGAVLAGALGCGGSSSPTSDFCQQSSAAMCHRAYACTPAAMQDTNFHNAWGPSETACTMGLAQLCTSECGVGKQVNAAAKTQCFSDINTQACSTVADGTLGNSCADVCVDAPMGTGGTNGGAGGSSGGTISDPIVYCQMSLNKTCDRAFQCIPASMQDADFVSNYGSTVAMCKAMTTTTCVDPTTNCPTYNPASGASCVAALTNDSCADLVFLNGIFPPASCFSACGN
jgi:hypothetical protein